MHGWSMSMSQIHSTLFAIQDIVNAGRGVVATQKIPADTVILKSGRPAFHVIFKTYAKETCGQCFLWDRGRTLSVRDNECGKVFCSTECRDEWMKEQGDIGVEAWKCVATFVRAKGKGTNEDAMMADYGPRPRKGQIDAAWHVVDAQTNAVRQQRESTLPPTKAEKKSIQAIMRKIGSSLEPDMLSYFLSGTLLQHYDQKQWHEEVMALAMDVEPYKDFHELEMACLSYLQLTSILPTKLLPLLTPELCRTITLADNHNAFGIRAGGEDSEEYMGYGVYPSASYFNHSCTPNVLKRRVGNEWVFTSARVIKEGEQCCITYMGGDEKDMACPERRRRLNDFWGFTCMCERCQIESNT